MFQLRLVTFPKILDINFKTVSHLRLLFGQKKSIVVHPNAKFNLDTRHLAEEAA
jgi:hypothetical protein